MSARVILMGTRIRMGAMHLPSNRTSGEVHFSGPVPAVIPAMVTLPATVTWTGVMHLSSSWILEEVPFSIPVPIV